jgi:hypothetical protein
MARPRLPTARLEASGAFLKDPQRRRARANEPRVTGPVGDPPAFLDGAQRAVWCELCALAPWLVSADRICLEVAVRLLADLRTQGGLPAPLLAQLMNALVRLGFTPADRSRIEAPPPELEFDPAEQFFA